MSSEVLHTRKNNREPNEIILYDDYAEVVLYDRHNIECARAKVSLDKLAIIRLYKWCAYLRDRSSYAVTTINGVIVKMHNVLFDPPEGMVVDHIYRDGLDNRNDKVRICTQLDNSRNVGVKKNNSSGYPGVTKHGNRWRSRIRLNYQWISLGVFDDVQDAITARTTAEQQYYGQFAPISE